MKFCQSLFLTVSASVALNCGGGDETTGSGFGADGVGAGQTVGGAASAAGGRAGTAGSVAPGGSVGTSGAAATGGGESQAGANVAGAGEVGGGVSGIAGSAGTGTAGNGPGGMSNGGGAPGAGGTPDEFGGAGAAGGELGSGGATALGGAGAGGSVGGSGTGGSDMGGSDMGGSDMGGAASCDQSPPPGNVSAWIDESWDAQLGNNIRSRKAWLLDNVIKGQGQINLCVRWGASSAPSAEAKSQLAPSVENWFNDWFKALGNYDCFPYGQGIKTKLTGWAVKPGNESWVSDLGPDVKIYTETDGEGEPKCPDACSFFENWDHEFPRCPGGEAFHTDYWIWVDDRLPGGGAAAVGGDWGLRMPVANFLRSLGQSGDNVIEHEMGHGFGFQDYYDWNGSRPQGGSLMIVGSARSGVPTVADTWLLRRTWSEMRVLRGW